MEFIAAICPQCTGNLQLPSNKDVLKCMYCGVEIVVKEAAKLVQSQGNAGNYLKLAVVAEQAGNYVEAFSYYSKTLEIDPNNYKAWQGKGTSTGWQSNLISNRFDEMLNYYNNAIELCDSLSDIETLKKDISNSLTRIAEAYFDISLEHVVKYMGVSDARFEHIDRCKDTVKLLDIAISNNPEQIDARTLLIDICNRIVKMTGIMADEKKLFDDFKNKHTGEIKSTDVATTDIYKNLPGYLILFILVFSFGFVFTLSKYYLEISSGVGLFFSTIFGGAFTNKILCSIFSTFMPKKPSVNS